MAALIAIATIGLVVALWWAGTAGLSGAALVTARFDALRTGLSIGIGGGGIFALYLAWRRQHATEIGLVQKERDQADVARAYELQRETAEHARQHNERVAVMTERDAEARRITDLYAKSVEQLGSEKAPVRHGGLYALERLAQDHPDSPALRQTVVNVLCAYLRAPFDLPGDPPNADTEQAVRDEYRERVQEREVRLTAQRIITTHLNPGNDAEHLATTFWIDIDLDLTAAVLIDWNVENCLLHNATFSRATFTGDAVFVKTTFTGEAMFDEATFAEVSWFTDAAFNMSTMFNRAVFSYDAMFGGTTYTGRAIFDGANFTKDAWFDEATFHEDARFTGSTFAQDTCFIKASFNEAWFVATFTWNAWFDQATFHERAIFGERKLIEGASFSGATLRYSSSRPPHKYSSWPTGWKPSSDHVAIEGRKGTWHSLLETGAAPSRSEDQTSESAGG